MPMMVATSAWRVNFKMKLFKINNEFFQSKVARRVTGLFLLSALVPLIATAILSKTYLTSILIDQGYSNLQSEGKYYVMSLFDRLLHIETRLTNIANNLNESKNKKIILENYYGNEFLSLKKERVSTTALITNVSEESNNKSRIYSRTSDNGKTNIFMSLQLKQNNKNTSTYLTAQINTDYLWDSQPKSNSNFNICIINQDGGMFYCSKALPDTITLNNTQRTSDNKKIEHWASNDGNYISASKVLFLKSRFNSTNWKIIITQLEEDVLSPASTFNRLFPLVIILTLLVVLSLSMAQIQRILIPLKKLISGTQRIAKREFNEKVEVESNDEFYDLAQSFNDMSERLKKQFSAFTILSSIDKLILSDTQGDDIYYSVLKHMQDVAPCDIASVTVLEHDAPKMGKTYLSKQTVATENNIRILLSDEDIKTLHSPTNYNDMLLQAEGQHFLAPIKEFGAEHVCVFPVTVNEKIAAIISLGFISEVTLNTDDLQQVRNIADRIAVALTAIARDKKLYHQSHYDSLTNLPNRQLISIRLDQEIKHCLREDSSMAILFLDLDHFKRVNDTLGHAVGDSLLQEVAERLKNCVRDTDTVARLGGDEFTIMLTGSLDNKNIREIADNIITELEKPFTINRHEIFIGTSIGISVFPNNGMTGTELFKNADTAMYRVKEQGRGKHLFFEEQMNIEEVERANLERDMRHALERNEFTLNYQPIINITTSNIVGAEALIRWRHPVHGIIPSSKFITVAEETGIIEKIGDWVLRTACQQLALWEENNVVIDRMAVNVSCRQFIQHDFDKHVSSILEETNIAPDKLELEITETLLMHERIDSMKILENLSAKNIHLSIDDFGTGFSSLSYLKRFPLNTLKIDRSFMQDVPTDEDAKSIVKSIIALAHTLNLSVIAEGIESEDQLAILHENNCDFAQGFFFSKPLTADEFEEFYLKQNNIVKFKPCSSKIPPIY